MRCGETENTSAKAQEFWSHGTIAGQRVDRILHRTERGVWVEIGAERWVVPYQDSGIAQKVELQIVD